MIITGKIPKRHLRAIHFFAEQLFTPQKRRHLYLNVKYLKNMEYLGLASVEDYNVLGMPNAFLIEVKRNTEEEMIKTLGHELIHCRQYSRGELNETMTMWRGRRVDSDEIPYFEQPWEIEAETLGLKLYNDFMKENYHRDV
jgi:hypothetical protein